MTPTTTTYILCGLLHNRRTHRTKFSDIVLLYIIQIFKSFNDNLYIEFIVFQKSRRGKISVVDSKLVFEIVVQG